MSIEPMLLRPQLLAEGMTDKQIAAALRSEWVRVRAGGYAKLDAWRCLDRSEQHRRLVVATAAKLGDSSTVGFVSAAELLGLPVVDSGRHGDRVHVYRNASNGGYRKGSVHAHVGVIDPADTIVVDGITITSVTRTVVDCARLLPLSGGVAMADQALHAGRTTLDALVEATRRQSGHRGIGKAKTMLTVADPRAESVGETISRMVLRGAGLPSPELQVEIRVRDGIVVRVDFCWPDRRVIGEFDGREKYGRFLRPGETVADAVWREKRREDMLRAMGWTVVRWTWADLADPAALAQRIEAAFAAARLAA